MIFILIFLGLLGAAIGGQINRAIYRWAWNPRAISPWSAPPEGAAKRTWVDCIPVFGWWHLRRESNLHGAGFWLRPLCIELISGCGLAALYWFEVRGGLLPPALAPRFPAPLPIALMHGVHAEFCAHAILFALMLIATFIDVDEKTIPDQITIPGTLIALILAVVLPASLLPVLATAPTGPVAPGSQISSLLLATPLPWPPTLDGRLGLALGLFCWFGWCYALLPKTIWTRHGIVKAIRYLVASILRHRWSIRIGCLALVGGVAVTFVWFRGPTWPELLSSLVGLGFGVGLVWAIRVVFSAMLGKEAMGFGDVTLMGMIGAFLGWQPAMIIFFLAPFTSLAIAFAQWIITGRRDIPFGPFLCAAATILLIAWSPIWQDVGDLFSLGLGIPVILVLAIFLMVVLLGMLQVTMRLFGIRD